MNNADIEAARRLIAQFEGTALGRHNSGQGIARIIDFQGQPESPSVGQVWFEGRVLMIWDGKKWVKP